MRKWVIGIVVALVVAVAGVCGYAIATGLRADHPVGFEVVSVADPKGAPLQVAIWYPTQARAWPSLQGLIVQWVATGAAVDGTRHPLVIISHGMAGSLASHADTALALADAGFVVAAPLHTGDNYKDQSAIGKPPWFVDRARHVHLTISYMLDAWRERARIDADKIGVFGFSAGGTTALIAIGGQPDLDSIAEHCAKAPEFACQLWRSRKTGFSGGYDFIHDPRIKAAVVIAPGMGFAFSPYGLGGVRVPVQLWNGADDVNVPPASNAVVVRRELGRRAEWHLVPNAGHFSFMVPCGLTGLIAPKPLCSERPGFDRAEFHKTFNAAVVGFFRERLAAAPRFSCVRTLLPVCLPSPYLDHFGYGGMGGSFDAYDQRVSRNWPATLDRSDFKIDAGHPDYIVEYSRLGLDVACTRNWCVYYRKECNAPNTICFYQLLKPVRAGKSGERERVMTGMETFVRVIDENLIVRIQNDVMIEVNARDESPEYLPLKAFSHSYLMKDRLPSGEGMTMCDPCKQMQGCQRPLVEEAESLRSWCTTRR
jgi:predicted dienelactone hydrolase